MAAQMDLWSAPVPLPVQTPESEVTEAKSAHGLRPYQEEAVSNAIRELGDVRSTLIVMPTGSGKTKVMTEIARRRGQDKILVLAHRDELLQQARERFARDCGERVGLDKAGDFAADERIVVGSIQTVSMPARLERFSPSRFDTIMVDECFPAGTMIDGRPIESIQLGDMVWSIDHTDGTFAKRMVSRLFRKTSSSLMRLWYDATETTVTGSHPYFVKGRGYVEANAIAPGDMLCVCKSIQGSHLGSSKPAKTVRETRVQERLVVPDDGGNEPCPCERSNGCKQSNAQGGQPGANEENLSQDRTSSKGSRGQWCGSNESRTGNCECARLGDASGSTNEDAERVRISDLLQAGRREQGIDGCGGSRRIEPYLLEQKGAGREEGFFLAWARVDRVESVEPASSGGIAVYNFEVEGAHTYFANGALVHNCHHSPATSYRKVLDYFPDAKIVGVTATPDRADEKAMGQIFDSVAFLYEIENAITDGYLCDVRCTRIEIAGTDLSSVKTVAGDLNQGDLDKVMAIEEVLLGVADATIREAGDRRTLLFTTSVANADRLAEIMNRHREGCAMAVNGKTEIDERRGILKAHQGGDFQFLVNCAITTEGYDDPAISCVAIARPTKSRALYTQMAGRGLRIFPDKSDALLLDFCGNSGRHKLASALDVLGGRYTEEEEELAQELVKKSPGMRARDALDAAHMQAEREKQLAEEAAKRAAIKAKAIYSKQDVNPFGVFHMDVKHDLELSERFGGKVASEKQVACLQKFKIPIPQGCTAQLASKLIGTAITRRQKDLASFSQLKTLQKYGVTDINIGFKTASAVIDAIANNRWKPLPFARLDSLLHGGGDF